MDQRDRDGFRKNAEGYLDLTAYEAIKHYDDEDRRFHKLINTIHYLCDLADFKIDGRITLIDKSTGRIWK